MTEFAIIISVLIMIIYAFSLGRVMLYERKINIFQKEMEQKRMQEKRRTQLKSIYKGRIKKIKEKYEPKIEELERKRRFILEKLPFIKN